MLPQVVVYWMTVLAIDVTFLKEEEVGAMLFSSKFMNFLWSTRLLSSKLIAWESTDLEALVG